jgi:hypothetical protein
MAFNFSPKIVTDGLILCLDAANTKSYVSGSTTWNDMSRGGNTMALVNGPTFNSNNGGSIVFDGVDDRASITSSINTGQNFTVSAWIFPTLLGTTRRTVVANSYIDVGTTNGWFFSTAGFGVSNTFFMSIGRDTAYRVAPANTLSTNTWTHIVGVVQGGGSGITFYKNGVALTTYANSLLTSVSITYTHPQFNVGFRNVGSIETDPYTGRIAQTSIYNRALSATEVLQNYNATKSRYI